MDPLSLLCRLAASVPPPRFHTVKYAGVLASASRPRRRASASDRALRSHKSLRGRTKTPLRNMKCPDAGSPQGGSFSLDSCNVLLHEVLDVWFAREVRPRMRGRAHLVRYADDAVMLFEYEEDARRVMAVLPKRSGKYGLTLHPDKTRLLPFERPDRMMRRRDADEGSYKPATFDFLGFTIHWGKSLAGKCGQ
ncbi:reverse transcriptase domain-containing protein [Sorangium sp. So ce367]